MNNPETIASEDQKSHSAAAGVAATADELSTSKSIGAIIQKFYLLFVCHSFEALEHIVIVALVYILVCLLVYRLIFHSWITRRFRTWTNVKFPQCNRVLIVTAHPDDESMFFGPTILSLAKQPNCQLYLLCLSNGNYEHKACSRQKELWNACRVLNIPAENITLINATQLQDDPAANWKSPIIAKQILKQVHSLDIDMIITFDRDGVSHHPNHCAIFYSSVSVYVASLLPDGCRLFTLESINVCRKYTFLFDLLLTMTISSYWCVLSWGDFRLVQKAMTEHHSQMVWFRRLYIIFSRYMIINSFREMNVSDAELEIQLASLKST